jgi:hypothetical protein
LAAASSWKRPASPQVCITLPILVGTDGHHECPNHCNTIGIDEPPEVQFGKVMFLPDEAMPAFSISSALDAGPHSPPCSTTWLPDGSSAGLKMQWPGRSCHLLRRCRRDAAADHFATVFQRTNCDGYARLCHGAPRSSWTCLVAADLRPARAGTAAHRQGGVWPGTARPSMT